MVKQVFCFLFFVLLLGFTVSCEDQKVASKTEPKVIANCPPGYHPCAEDSSACCPYDIPATMEQTQIDWPSLADTPWPMYMHDPQLTGRSSYEGPSLGEYDTLYNQSGEVYSNPIIDPYGNILFTAKTNALNTTGVLFSVSLDGQLNWEIELGHSKIYNVGTPVITADNYFYLASSDGESGYLIKGDLSGNIVWKYNFEAPYSRKIKGSPNISKNGALIFICGFGNALYAIKSDGTLGWKYDVSPNNTETVPAISPDGNTIYFISDDNVLRATDLSGKLIWAMTLSTNSSASRTHPVVDSDGNIYIYCDKKLFSVSSTGYIRWQTDEKWDGFFFNGISIGPNGTIHLTLSYAYLIYHYDGSLVLNFDLWNIGSGIDDAVVTDKNGNSYLGIDFAKPDNSNSPWNLVNLVSFDPFGNLRFKMKIGNEKGFHDIDSTPCLLPNYLITGTSAWLPGPFLVKVK